jgi:hypothetical protein
MWRMTVDRASMAFNVAASGGFIVDPRDSRHMQPLSVLGGLVSLGIVVWAVLAALAVPGALGVSGGATLTLGLVLIALAAIVVGGVTGATGTATTYW